MVGDGGGTAPAFPKVVIGADNVARVLASNFLVLAKIDARVEPREVNGQPGAIVRDRDDKVVGTLTLDVYGGRIRRSARWPTRQARAPGSAAGRLGDCSRG
jgi:RNA polymerase sigma-70 factor (ECF subfamily)